jgi:hypothetical protein
MATKFWNLTSSNKPEKRFLKLKLDAEERQRRNPGKTHFDVENF